MTGMGTGGWQVWGLVEEGKLTSSVSPARASPAPRDCHKASSRGKAWRSSGPLSCKPTGTVRTLPPSESSETGSGLWLLPSSLTADTHRQSPCYPGGTSSITMSRPGDHPLCPGPHDLLPAPISAILLALPFLLGKAFRFRSDQVLLHKTLPWSPKAKVPTSLQDLPPPPL